MSFPSLLTTVVFTLSLACSQAWGRPPVKPQKSNTTASPSAEQPDDETISGFLPSASGMEANLASTLCSGLWTFSTYESCFPPNLQPPHKCQYCARTCRSKGGLTHHENICKSRHNPPESEPISVVPPSPDDASLDEEFAQDEAPLTLAECSRLVSAYVEQPEWQDFLDSGRHATTQTTDVNTGWAGLKLDTVCPADKETPFPALTTATLNTLMQLSPTIRRLHQQLQTGDDPLADRDDLKAFIKKADHNSNELFAGGNHSLVIKWRKGPGYVFKIARSEQDHIRLNRERNLYIWLRDPDNVLINLTTTPMRAAFNIHGKPILALRQVDGTARDRLRFMRQHHSLNERLDFALSVIFHFCQIYRRFLEKDVLLADRHDDNIGFNEIPLQGKKSKELDEAILQVPVMLDLDPYWFGDREFRMIQLHLPTWAPVIVGLWEEVFTPHSSDKHDSQTSQIRINVIDQIRKFATPVFSSSSPALPETEGDNIETALQSCINHWFQSTNPEYSEMLAEARSHIEPLLTSLNQWDSTLRTVTEWNTQLQESIGEVLQWLNSWKNDTEFSLLNDSTDEGIIRAPSPQGTASPRNQQIFTLLSIIRGKLGCQKCSRTFTSNTDFRKHWQLHQQNKLQHCETCGGDFTDITLHKRMHTGEKPYKCEHCGRCFSETGRLKIHLRSHSGERPYKCEHCGSTFKTAGTLKVHLRSHTGEKPYKCEHCGRAFTTTGNLQNHLRTHTGEKPYKCEHCGKTFSRNNTLQAHLRTHSGDKPYQCKHCSQCFSQRGNLQSHLRTHSGDKPYKCEHCGRCFSQRSNLQKHLHAHSGDKPLKCQHCDKCFCDTGALGTHLRTHSGVKPYKCKHCGKCFSQSSNLKIHLRIHSGDKPYTCKHCGKCFAQSSNLQSHQRTHSGDRPCKCNHCGKCFTHSRTLKDHLHTHSGDKPYKCDHCDKCFSQSSNLKKHLRIHFGEKPYKCKHCGKSFSDTSNTNKHQKKCRIE